MQISAWDYWPNPFFYHETGIHRNTRRNLFHFNVMSLVFFFPSFLSEVISKWGQLWSKDWWDSKPCLNCKSSPDPKVVFDPALIQTCYTLLKKTCAAPGWFRLCCLCSSSIKKKKQCRYLLIVLWYESYGRGETQARKSKKLNSFPFVKSCFTVCLQINLLSK